METKETLVFNKYELDVELSSEQILKDLRNHMYTDENGLGFTNLRLEDNVIEAVLIIRTPTSIRVYDPISEIFNTNIVYMYDEVEIFIDTLLHVIYTMAPVTKFNKAKTLLRSSIKTKITYRNLNFSTMKILEIVELLNLNPCISDLTIKNFQYKEGAYGRYIVHVEDPSIGKELINTYKDSVSKVTIKLEASQFSNFILSTSAQNTFTLKSQEADFWAIVNLLKVHI